MQEIRWHGRGGQGGFTAARLLGAAASLEGAYAMAFPSFGPERRGAPVLGFTKISDTKIFDRSPVTRPGYMVVFDESLLHSDIAKGMSEPGIVLVNSTKSAIDSINAKRVVTFDAEKLAQEILGRAVVNTTLLGALAGLSGMVSIDAVCEAIGQNFSGKLAGSNQEVARRAFAAVKP